MYEGQDAVGPAVYGNQIRGLGSPSAMANQLAKQPNMPTVASLVEQIHKLTSEAGALASRIAASICGSVPESNGQTRPSPMSVIDHHHDTITELSAIIEDLRRAAQGLGL